MATLAAAFRSALSFVVVVMEAETSGVWERLAEVVFTEVDDTGVAVIELPIIAADNGAADSDVMATIGF